MKINASDCLISVKDTRNLLKCRSLCFGIKEPYECQFDYIPRGVEQCEVPMFGEAIPGNFVGLTRYTCQRGRFQPEASGYMVDTLTFP